MSFIEYLKGSWRSTSDELQQAWTALNYDLLHHQKATTPPPTPSTSFHRVFPLERQPSSMIHALEQSSFSTFPPSCLGVIKYPRSSLNEKSSIPDFRTNHLNQEFFDEISRCPRDDCLELQDTYQNNTAANSAGEKRKLTTSEHSESEVKRGKFTEAKIEKAACQVHGILSHPGGRQCTYTITAEELQRRVCPPESLTKVDMISYVRLAKNSARSLLEKNGVKTNHWNRRSVHTVFSRMCEAEARTLANGIMDVNYQYFPSKWFARQMIESIMKSKNGLSKMELLLQRLRNNEALKASLFDMYLEIERRQSDSELDTFNKISHTFGTLNLQNHIKFMLRYLDEESRMVSGLLQLG